ncbi:MAG TPA: peptidylprolyl isomerase [Terriglobia bacterium]|nr:peptidylprolyl isomerase [Terriglobia bacterium]
MMTKKIPIFLTAAVILAILALPVLSAGRVVERIIARVNNEIVTERQFAQKQAELRAQLAKEYSGADLEAQYKEQSKNLLRDLIDQDLMVQRAKDLDIKVEPEVVKHLDEIRRQGHFATQEDLQAEVEKQGMVWEDFEDNIRRDALMREVIGGEVGRHITISDQEKRKYYEAHKQDFTFSDGVHLGEILVSTESRKPEEAKKRAEDALAELKAGSRWDVVAKKYSDHQSVNEGGDIGFFEAGTLNTSLAPAIAKLEDNDFSDLIQTKYGYMILKVYERRKQGIAKYEDVEMKISDLLYSQQMEPALREYLRTLRKESYIYLASGYIDTGAERSTQAALSDGTQ